MQWMEVCVDLRGTVHWCASIGQSFLACTGLIKETQKIRWSTNQQAHSLIVSMPHSTRHTKRSTSPQNYAITCGFCKHNNKLHTSDYLNPPKNYTCVCLCLQIDLFYPLHCTACACVCLHAHVPMHVVARLLALQSFWHCVSRISMLPLFCDMVAWQQNSVPLSFTFNAKCSSVFQPMSTVAKWKRDDRRKMEKFTKEAKYNILLENICYWIDRFSRDKQK